MTEARVVQSLASDLIGRHLDGTWAFAFDNAKRRAGACDYSRRRITVSRFVSAGASDDEVEQILLHEIAHAIAGHAAAHGPGWRGVAARLGYRGGRLHTLEIAEAAAPWVGVCAAGHEHVRFRRPSVPLSCGRCSTRFSRAALIVWRRRQHAVA